MATVPRPRAARRPRTTLKSIGTRPIRPDGVDKVTGRAKFGADLILPGMLVGKVLRSPHAARAHPLDRHREGRRRCPGVKAVVTRDDFRDLPSEFVPAGEMLVNYRDMARNVHRARQGALRRPRGGRGRRDQRQGRQARRSS